MAGRSAQVLEQLNTNVQYLICYGYTISAEMHYTSHNNFCNLYSAVTAHLQLSSYFALYKYS